MQIPATLHMSVQSWCKEDSQMDRQDGERLRNAAFNLASLLERWSWLHGTDPVLCQDRGNLAWKNNPG